jgi:DNA-binding MarR family transcriptional regulator
MSSQSLAPRDAPDAVVDAVLLASRVLVAVAARSLADAGEKVTLTQYRTLVVLASCGPQSLAGLAQAVGVTPATATRMCDRLVRKSLIRRRTEREDRRQLRVVLTAKGRSLVDDVTDRRRKEIARITDEIPAAEQAALVHALGRLASAAGEVPEQDWTTGWDL